MSAGLDVGSSVHSSTSESACGGAGAGVGGVADETSLISPKAAAAVCCGTAHTIVITGTLSLWGCFTVSYACGLLYFSPYSMTMCEF